MQEDIAERQPETASAGPAGEPGSQQGLRLVRWSYDWVGLVVLVGVLVTAALALVSADLAASNERHLLKLRSKEVASVFTSALPDIQTPLGAAVALANITGANPSKFAQFASAYVGRPNSQFASMSVWRVGHFDRGPVVRVGAKPELSQARGGVIPILRAAAKRTGSHAKLTVRGLLHASQPRLAYAYAGSRPGAFIVEAESALAKSRYTRLPPNSAYSNIDVAIYVGKRPVPRRLLLSTVRHLPLPGQHSVTIIPFGSDDLTAVISARQPLGGSLPEQMPWVIAIVGVLLTAGAGVLTLRLIRGRRRAQRLAAENRRLYSEQREIASGLQRALLPEKLPEIAGVRLAGLYDAGMPGIDIGGDWYDMIQLGQDRLLLVVGDVSGRGIRAAAAMASVRAAIQFAAQTDDPEAFLPKLSGLRSLREQGMLATVLCVIIELREQCVHVTSAGHLPPLLVAEGRSEFLSSGVGLPIGVDTDATYESTSFPIPDGACLFGFTDGLVERHGESLDAGLERLRRAAAAAASRDLDQMMAAILEQVREPQSVDDTAMTGVQWVTRDQG